MDISDDRTAWGSRLRTTGADVLVVAIDLRTGRYTFTNHLRGLCAHGIYEPMSGAT